MTRLPDDWELNPGAMEHAIRAAEAAMGRPLPPDHVGFLREHDGGEGFLGDNYLVLWRAEELAPFNREYEVQEYAPDVLLFGTDGANEGYGFDVRNAMAVVQIPRVGMDRRHIRSVARTFGEMLERLAAPA